MLVAASTSPPSSGTRARVAVDVLDTHREVRQPGLVQRARPERLGLTLGRVVQELEHEPVAHEIGRGQPERRRQPHQLGRQVVGGLDLAVEGEAEQLDVEPLRPFEIGDALPDVVERDSAHGGSLARGRGRCQPGRISRAHARSGGDGLRS